MVLRRNKWIEHMAIHAVNQVLTRTRVSSFARRFPGTTPITANRRRDNCKTSRISYTHHQN